MGIDFILLDSKLSGTLDYFNRNTSDLLRDTPVASPPNIFGSTLLNLGELDTNGFEITLNYSAISSQDLSWDLGFNLSNFKVNLVNISDQDQFVTYSGNLGSPGLNNTYPIVLEEGAVLGNIRAGEFAGYDSDGRTLIINQETGEPTLERNLDRDGIIVGNGLPEYSFGINNTLRYKNLDLKARVESFISDMAEAYGWADLVICRAGALTISELTAAGVGALLIPYPYAADDHQFHNGEWLVSLGAAYMVKEQDLTDKLLVSILNEWLGNPVKLDSMAMNAKKLARVGVAELVADICMEPL